MVTDFYPPYAGGVEILVSNLSHELVRRGYEVAVATLSSPTSPAEEMDDGVRVHRIRTSTQRIPLLFATEDRPWAPPVPDPAAVSALRSIVADERPDIVHGHDWLARSYLPLKRRSGPPLLMTLHYYTLSCPKKNLMHLGKPCAGPGLAKCLACAGRHYGTLKGTTVTLGHRAFAPSEAKLVDLFLPVSEATAHGNGLRQARVPYRVIPNFVRPAPLETAYEEYLRQLPEGPFLLFVGDVRVDKGVPILLAAYDNLRQPPPLVLIGKVSPETPRDLPQGVTLLRDWPNGAVRNAMARCLALVTPSVWPEPFGIVVVEACAAGRPVVGSAIGGIPEIVRDGEEGLLVPPGDVSALSYALERIVSDYGLREKLAANARRRAQNYTPVSVLPQVEAAYADVLRTAAQRAARRSQRS